MSWKLAVAVSIAAAAIGFYAIGPDGLIAGIIGLIGLKAQPKRGPIKVSKEGMKKLERIEALHKRKQAREDEAAKKAVQDAKEEADKVATDNELAGDKLDSLLIDTED